MQDELPAAIKNAVKVIYAGAAAYVVSFAVNLPAMVKRTTKTLTNPQAQPGTHVKAHPPFTQAQAGRIALIAAVIVGLVYVALWLWMAWANKGGRPWARTLSTVFFAASTVAKPALIGLQSGVAGMTLGWAVWLIGAGAVALLWLPESNAYYRVKRMGEPRRQALPPFIAAD